MTLCDCKKNVPYPAYHVKLVCSKCGKEIDSTDIADLNQRLAEVAKKYHALESQLAAEKQDAAVGKALREMKAHVHVLDLFQPLPSDVINTDCFEVMVTDKNRFLESYTGTTPYAAFVNAGLIPDGVKETK